jgi:hypothetical protein
MSENLPCTLLIDHCGSWINVDKNGEGISNGNHCRDNDFADTDLEVYTNLVMTLRKSISSSTSDISLTSSVD